MFCILYDFYLFAEKKDKLTNDIDDEFCMKKGSFWRYFFKYQLFCFRLICDRMRSVAKMKIKTKYSANDSVILNLY